MDPFDRRTQRKSTRPVTEKEREARRLRLKKHYERDPDYFKKRAKERYDKNKKAGCERMREYRKARKFTALGHAQDLIRLSTRRSKEKDWPLTIDVAWVMRRMEAAEHRCEVTGIPFVYDEKPRNPWQPSIDRINQSKPYSPKNCRVVVLMYNYARNASSDADVERFAREFVAKLG